MKTKRISGRELAWRTGLGVLFLAGACLASLGMPAGGWVGVLAFVGFVGNIVGAAVVVLHHNPAEAE